MNEWLDGEKYICRVLLFPQPTGELRRPILIRSTAFQSNLDDFSMMLRQIVDRQTPIVVRLRVHVILCGFPRIGLLGDSRKFGSNADFLTPW